MGQIAKKWFKHSSEFQIMSLSLNSRGINPIEHSWFHLEIVIHAALLPFCNMRDLQTQLLSISYQISQITY